jgi:hypothetical protein
MHERESSPPEECTALCPPWKVVAAQARRIIAIDAIVLFFCKGIEGLLLLRDSKILYDARGYKCLCGEVG